MQSWPRAFTFNAESLGSAWYEYVLLKRFISSVVDPVLSAQPADGMSASAAGDQDAGNETGSGMSGGAGGLEELSPLLRLPPELLLAIVAATQDVSFKALLALSQSCRILHRFSYDQAIRRAVRLESVRWSRRRGANRCMSVDGLACF